MHQLLHISVLLGSLISSKAANINVPNATETQLNTVEEDANAKNLEELQKEKEDLYNKIHKAIDEAIPELENSNDTEALTGIDDLKTLKQQITEIHKATDSDDDNPEFRRKLSLTIDKDKDVGRKGDFWKKFKKNEFEERLKKSRDKKYTSLPRVWNRQKIAEQISLWVQKQHEEKRKKKELAAKLKLNFERCPDFGVGKQRKKVHGQKKKAHRFPCCRKCCKKSYLGCL